MNDTRWWRTRKPGMPWIYFQLEPDDTPVSRARLALRVCKLQPSVELYPVADKPASLKPIAGREGYFTEGSL